MSEFTILAEYNNYKLECRTEYYERQTNKIWGAIKYQFEDNYHCIWLGDIWRDKDYKEFLISKVKDIKYIDNRDKGFYCIYCKKYSDKCQMGWGITIRIDGDYNNRMIIKEHYDGCWGWD